MPSTVVNVQESAATKVPLVNTSLTPSSISTNLSVGIAAEVSPVDVRWYVKVATPSVPPVSTAMVNVSATADV